MMNLHNILKGYWTQEEGWKLRVYLEQPLFMLMRKMQERTSWSSTRVGDYRSKVPEPVRVRGAREHGGGGAWLSAGAQIGRPLQWEGNPWWLWAEVGHNLVFVSKALSCCNVYSRVCVLVYVMGARIWNRKTFKMPLQWSRWKMVETGMRVVVVEMRRSD